MAVKYNPFLDTFDFVQDVTGYLTQATADGLYVSQSSIYGTAEIDTTSYAGQPVYMKGNGHIDQAQADDLSTTRVVGILVSDATATTSATFVKDGSVSMADWTNVIGSADLTTGSIYYLSAGSPGLLTTTAPTTAGQFVCKIGQAVSTTKLALEIQQTIKL